MFPTFPHCEGVRRPEVLRVTARSGLQVGGALVQRVESVRVAVRGPDLGRAGARKPRGVRATGYLVLRRGSDGTAERKHPGVFLLDEALHAARRCVGLYARVSIPTRATARYWWHLRVYFSGVEQVLLTLS